MEKTRIALIGPVMCNSGISSVVDTLLQSKILAENYKFEKFNSSNYRDSQPLVNFLSFWKSFIKYFYFLVRRRISIAHIHSSHGKSFYRKFFFVLVSSLFKVKTIFHLHSSLFDEFFISAEGIRKKLIEYVFRKADAVITLCEDWREKLEMKYRLGKHLVIYNPVSLTEREVRDNRERKSGLILFLGFLIKTKGIYDLIEIAKRLSEEKVPCKLLVCGKGREEKSFLQKIKENSLKNVEFKGWVSGQEKTKILKESEIFFLPSYQEGIPMALLEAMSYGLPIISTRVGGIPEVVREGENGYLLQPGDINGFVKRIRSLLGDQERKESFGKRSRSLAERFEKELISKEHLKLYESLLGRVRNEANNSELSHRKT